MSVGWRKKSWPNQARPTQVWPRQVWPRQVWPRQVWFVLLVALALVATACGGDEEEAERGAAAPDVEVDEDAAEDALGGEPIELGFISIFSGRVAMLGETGFKAVEMAVDEINADGGVLGQPLEVEFKDTGANPEQAVRVAREFALEDEVDFIIDGSSSNESFAVSQASDQLGVPVLATGSEAKTLTDPENIREQVFRVARNTEFDGAANAQYAAEQDLDTWMAISPDYAYGRDCNGDFFEELRVLQPDVEVAVELWPALFEADYTPLIQQLIQAKPDAVYSCLWGGDLVAFIQQAQPFGLFDQVAFFTPNLADSLVLDALGEALPAGIHTGSRFAVGAPPTAANEQFDAEYRERYGEGPTNWSVQAYIATYMLANAIEEAGSTEPEEVVAALAGAELADSPWGDVRLLAEEHTLSNYFIGWGVTDPELEGYPVDFTFEADWEQVLEAAA